MSSELISGLIAAIVALLISLISSYVSFGVQREKARLDLESEFQQRLNSRKLQLYSEFMQRYSEEGQPRQEFTKYHELMLIASDEVIEAIDEWFDAARNFDSSSIQVGAPVDPMLPVLVASIEVVYAMRRDLGHSKSDESRRIFAILASRTHGSSFINPLKQTDR